MSKKTEIVNMVRRKKHEFLSSFRSLTGKSELDMRKENKMDYQVLDNQFRDIYERGNEIEDDSRIFVKGFTFGLTGLYFFLVFFIGPFFVTLFNSNAHGHFFKVFFLLFLYGFGTIFRTFLFILFGFGIYLITNTFTQRYWDSQHMDQSKEMLSQYKDDSRLQQPEELSENYFVFPDSGMHSKTTDVTTILSHIPLSDVGLDLIDMPVLSDGETDVDENGTVLNRNLKSYDENGNVMVSKVSMLDLEYGERLLDSSGIPRPKGKNARYIKDVLRKRYNPSELLYNPMERFGKSNEYFLSEFINNDWYMPDYEVQRPAGAYIVDTEPNNTMVLAMTRAGKGQTVIEPTLDAWLRSDVQSNIVANDPKGELYLKFYYFARKRGYNVTAFNLMEPVKTDIYNPLGYAVEAARSGDNQKVEEYVKTIGDVFFPPDKSDDPMWPNAANATFQRSALGLIDYYMEEERELRIKAQTNNWSTSHLEHTLDILWGRVTLYNVYQMMTKLASKKSSDASFIHIDDDDPTEEKDYLTLFFDATAALPTNALRTSVQNQDNSLRAMAGSDKTISSVYGISLTAIKFFADDRISRLTSGRPSQNFDIVGMSFPRRFNVKIDAKFAKDNGLRGQSYEWTAYSDDTFSHELGEEFKFKNNVSSTGWVLYVTKGIFPTDITYFKMSVFEETTGLPIKTWYFKFTKDYKKSLDNRNFIIDTVSGERIVKDGILVEMQPQIQKEGLHVDVRYTVLIDGKNQSQSKTHQNQNISLGVGVSKKMLDSTYQLVSQEGELIQEIKPKTNGRLVFDPLLFDKLGRSRYFIVEKESNMKVTVDVRVYSSTKTEGASFVEKSTILKRQRVSLLESVGDDSPGRVGEIEHYDVLLFEQIDVRYVEEPTMAFFITPPHLMSYARIVLILINQMFNLQVDASYLTLDSQKPFYKSKYMFDEVGNLQSDGSGIPFLQTKESIGLAQGQYFTLILQTLQQLIDVYGESIDKILQGNTGNILYIKSTDDSMLETLQGLSGMMHRIEADSQTISNDMYKVFGSVDGKISNNRSVKEVPVISKNDMLQIPKGNLMVFGKGNPIWSRNQLAMPYSYESIFANPLQDFENPKVYNLRTIPTTANTMDFDILNNQPNFMEMVSKRIKQAKLSRHKLALFRQNNRINGRALTDFDLSRMDPEALAQEIMRATNEQLNEQERALEERSKSISDAMTAAFDDVLSPEQLSDSAIENTEFHEAFDQQEFLANQISQKVFANGVLSVHDLTHGVNDDVKEALRDAYVKCIDLFKRSGDFDVSDSGSLLLNGVTMVSSYKDSLLNARDDFGENSVDDEEKGLDDFLGDSSDSNLTSNDIDDYFITDDWLRYLSQQKSWSSIIDGEYDKAVGQCWLSK